MDGCTCFTFFEYIILNSMLSLICGNSSKQCKKFAKPELKVCIEEFEEKVSKVHEEKKEQEATTRNAEAHKQKMGSIDRILVTKDVGQNDRKSADGKLELLFFSRISLSSLLCKIYSVRVSYLSVV
jgi:condensin complex subunit 1